MGRVGMSLEDFDACTPSEFSAICKSYQEDEEQKMRMSWEQTRFLAVTNLQPYSKKPIKAQDVARFPWDNDGPAVKQGKSSLERMREVEARLMNAGQR